MHGSIMSEDGDTSDYLCHIVECNIKLETAVLTNAP